MGAIHSLGLPFWRVFSTPSSSAAPAGRSRWKEVLQKIYSKEPNILENLIQIQLKNKQTKKSILRMSKQFVSPLLKFKSFDFFQTGLVAGSSHPWRELGKEGSDVYEYLLVWRNNYNILFWSNFQGEVTPWFQSLLELMLSDTKLNR